MIIKRVDSLIELRDIESEANFKAIDIEVDGVSMVYIPTDLVDESTQVDLVKIIIEALREELHISYN